jgi:hypothetical protein
LKGLSHRGALLVVGKQPGSAQTWIPKTQAPSPAGYFVMRNRNGGMSMSIGEIRESFGRRRLWAGLAGLAVLVAATPVVPALSAESVLYSFKPRWPA